MQQCKRHGFDKNCAIVRDATHFFNSSRVQTSYISIEDAAKRLSLSSATLESRWIKRGALKVHDLGLWRRIDVNDLEALRTKLDGKVTAAEAGKMMSMHRSHLPNIERRGVIKSEKLGGKLGVRLYKIEDIKNFVEG